MMMTKAKRLKILLFLFAFNSITLYFYFYFSSHPDYFPNRSNPHFTRNHTKSHVSITATAKPWPILPSYLPWSHNREVPVRSCEGYFGNGFTLLVDALKLSPESHRKSVSDSSAGGGWFRCHYSQTLLSSICEGGQIRMIAEKIVMSKGGEELEMVLGRGEEEELPLFKPGAFQIEVLERSKIGKKLVNVDFLNNYLPNGAIHRHTMRQLVDSIELVGPNELNCSEWVEEPTVLVTRFEYANVFHTFTDWYSAYVASRVTGLPNRPHIVFMDGHCKMLAFLCFLVVPSITAVLAVACGRRS